MIDRAYAKVNLALDVYNIREDGYHDINSVMVPVSFYDELSINISANTTYTCNRKYIHFDEDNSIVKMIKVFQDEFNLHNEYEIRLNKQIPIQAGLAGGTSDAAATLRILQKISHLNLSDEQIKKLCLKVGADVYFNYYNKPAIVSGIGDELQFFDIKDDYYILILKPYSGVSTKRAYELLDMSICDHPDINSLTKALINGEDILPYMSNSLEQPAMLINKDIQVLKEDLKAKVGNGLMSGSGSSVFAISKNKELLQQLNDEYMKSKYFTRLTKIIKE